MYIPIYPNSQAQKTVLVAFYKASFLSKVVSYKRFLVLFLVIPKWIAATIHT